MRSDENTAKIPDRYFSAFLQTIGQDLKDAGLRGSVNHIARAICDFTKLSQEVQIGGSTYHDGQTHPVSYNQIADAADRSRSTVTRAVRKMLDAGVLEKKQEFSRGLNVFRFTAYDKLHARIAADPSIVQETHAYQFVPPAPELPAEEEASITEDPPLGSESPSARVRMNHNKEFKEFKDPHPTVSGNAAASADPMPTAEGEGGAVENSQKQEIPASAPGPGNEEKKNSLREKGDLSLSPKLLAQEFHELFGPEEPTERLLNVSALDFFRRAPDGTHSGILMDLMDDEKLRERFPDSKARGQACVLVVRRAFKILLKTCDEWGELKSPRFLNTPTGQRAISKARKEVCRPSLAVDEPSEAQSISESLKSINPEPEPSEPDSANDEPKQFAFPLKNSKAKAWDRDHTDEPLDPDIQALLERVQSGTPPPGMDDEPNFKKAKPLRGAKKGLT